MGHYFRFSFICQVCLFSARVLLRGGGLLRCAFDDNPGPDGRKIGKLYKIRATGRWIEKLNRKCTCKKPHIKLSKKVYNKFGRVGYTGVHKRLKESQAYPPAMGAAAIDAWASRKSRKCVPVSSSPASRVKQQLPNLGPKASPSWLQPTTTQGASWKSAPAAAPSSIACWLKPVAGSKPVAAKQLRNSEKNHRMKPQQAANAGSSSESWLQPSAGRAK